MRKDNEQEVKKDKGSPYDAYLENTKYAQGQKDSREYACRCGYPTSCLGNKRFQVKKQYSIN